MNDKYLQLLDKIKQLSNEHKDNTSIFLEDIELSNLNDSIVYSKEYTKDDVTFGVVCLYRDIISPIDYSDIDNIKINKSEKYYIKIIIVDKSNEIDNILFRRFDTKEKALDYSKELSNMIESESIDTLIEKIYNSLS